MTSEQLDYLVKVAASAAAYKMRQAEQMLVGADSLLVPSRRQRNDLLKKTAESYVLNKSNPATPHNFSLSKLSQASVYPETSMIPGNRPSLPGGDIADTPSSAQIDTEGMPLIGDALPDSATDPFAPIIAGGDVNSAADNDSSVPIEVRQFLGNKVLELKKLVQDVATHAWRINLSEPDTMRVVKESLKTISNKVADVPIQGVIDRIDDYLDEVGRSKRRSEGAAARDKKGNKPAPGDGASGPSAEGVAPGPSAEGAPTAVEAMPKESAANSAVIKYCNVIVSDPRSDYYGNVGKIDSSKLNNTVVPVIFGDKEEKFGRFQLRTIN